MVRGSNLNVTHVIRTELVAFAKIWIPLRNKLRRVDWVPCIGLSVWDEKVDQLFCSALSGKVKLKAVMSPKLSQLQLQESFLTSIKSSRKEQISFFVFLNIWHQLAEIVQLSYAIMCRSAYLSVKECGARHMFLGVCVLVYFCKSVFLLCNQKCECPDQAKNAQKHMWTSNLWVIVQKCNHYIVMLVR